MTGNTETTEFMGHNHPVPERGRVVVLLGKPNKPKRGEPNLMTQLWSHGWTVGIQ